MQLSMRVLVSLVAMNMLIACNPGAAVPAVAPEESLTAGTSQAASATPVPPTATRQPVPTWTPEPDIPDWPMLQRGDWDEAEPYALQRLLRYHGVSVIADGKFGGQTRAAVITFQSSKGLRADGLVGAQTWEALVENVVPREGQSGDAVYAAQKLLQYKFGYSIDLDGIFGPETSAAVLDFQSTHGLIPDGVVRAQTWQALIAIQP